MTWLEYLKAQGASEEEAKLLDTAVARKAFEKQQSDAAAAVEAATVEGRRKLDEYHDTIADWNTNEIQPDIIKANAAVVAANAEAARAKAALLEAAKRDEGLRQVAKNLGYDVGDGAPPANTPPANTPPGFDPTKLREEFIGALRTEGDLIMLTQDIAGEHASLFPGQRLNFTELGAKARASKKDLKTVWEEQYKIPEARAAQVAAAKKSDEDRIRKEEREKVETEMASRYGNPLTRPPMPSTSPFAKIMPSADTKQPWDRPDASGDRVKRATEAVIKKQQAVPTN